MKKLSGKSGEIYFFEYNAIYIYSAFLNKHDVKLQRCR
ncbi:Gp15 family bacteriophage protein [uncultured Clostridium sp.]